MASLTIPDEDLPVLKAISELDDPQFNSLISAFGETNPTLRRRQFIGNVKEKVKTIETDELSEICRVIFILYAMKERAELSAKDLANDVGESILESVSKDFEFSTGKKEILISRLQKLLGFEKTMAVTSKAFDVMTEHKHTFCRARVLSDIRPVFTSTADSASGAMIIHNLQIGFHDGGTGKHKEFYVALDTDDIKSLKEVIARAEKKTKALESILKSSSVPYLEV
ncbi:MAG: hypothetical protein ABR955_01625 [Verrucomicrobiota bacterium]|jgi:hypothetical protein